MKIYGDANNYIAIYYTTSNEFQYTMVKEGEKHLDMIIAPPAGETFNDKSVQLTIEAVDLEDRKYMSSYTENTSVMRLKCEQLKYEEAIEQEIIWNFRRDNPTPVDSCYARGYAHLPFMAYVGSLEKITVGGDSEACTHKFLGNINKIQIADKLPAGNDDFWPTMISNNDVFADTKNLNSQYIF